MWDCVRACPLLDVHVICLDSQYAISIICHPIFYPRSVPDIDCPSPQSRARRQISSLTLNYSQAEVFPVVIGAFVVLVVWFGFHLFELGGIVTTATTITANNNINS